MTRITNPRKRPSPPEPEPEDKKPFNTGDDRNIDAESSDDSDNEEVTVDSAVYERYQAVEESFLDLQKTKLLIAVCGRRGWGKSYLINSLSLDHSLAGSLWGKLPLPSRLDHETVTEAPTHLIHSPTPFMRFTWNRDGLDHTSNQSNGLRVPNNPCVDPSVKFEKNGKGEWQSECWGEAHHRYSNLDEIKNRGFLDCYHQIKDKQAQRQLLDLWAINQFLLRLGSWFGERRSLIVRIEIGMPHWPFHQDITLIDMPGWDTRNAMKESSSAVLQLVDGVISMVRPGFGAEEVTTLFEYGAFNQSAREPPFFLSVFLLCDSISPSQFSTIGNRFGWKNSSIMDEGHETDLRRRLSDMDLLSKNLAVLPHMTARYERAEHFRMVAQNSFFCPLVLHARQPSIDTIKSIEFVAQHIARFIRRQNLSKKLKVILHNQHHMH